MEENAIRMDGISGPLYTASELVDKVRMFYPRFNKSLLYYYYSKKMVEGKHYIKKDRYVLYTQDAFTSFKTKYENDL